MNNKTRKFYTVRYANPMTPYALTRELPNGVTLNPTRLDVLRAIAKNHYNLYSPEQIERAKREIIRSFS